MQNKNFYPLSSRIITVFISIIAGVSLAQDAPFVKPAESGYSPYISQDFPNRVYFGDTHVHTSYSADAGMIGNSLGPADAFRFARGKLVISSMGLPAKLKRPLDFMVVSDHAEGLGIAPLLNRSDPAVLDTDFGLQLHEYVQDGSVEAVGNAWNLWAGSRMTNDNPYSANPDFSRGPWGEIIDAAEAANEPGLFSALIGFEWSSTPEGNNLHRVVVYRDGKEVAMSRVPPSSDGNYNPEILWDWMESLQEDTGGQVLAIPHNGNLSNGLMFDETRYGTDEPINAEYAKRRQRFEPLYEVTQMKGDAEAHPVLSPNDEFADFETWDKGNMGAGPKTKDMLPREYARSALKRGLAYEKKLGINPFKIGLIGSTDSHTSLSTTQEDNFFGKVAQLEPTSDPVRFDEVIAGRLGSDSEQQFAWQTSASGLAAVWARENTRASIFDAMMRKEVYATTGTRIRVRVFGGWGFHSDDLQRSDLAAHGYQYGVPMGGDLTSRPAEALPGFLVQAIRDPDGANLDRIQIVKGWLDESGETHEKIWDIAVSNERTIDADGRSRESVGNTVNAKEATFSNSIGDAFMGAYWSDPEFNPDHRAFYYVRVIEIPTPRWTTVDAKVFGVAIPDQAPTSIQERAYTTPIWYTPN